MPKLADLLAQKAALDKKIADAQRAERGVAIAQIRALMAQYGLTAQDIATAGPAAAPAARGGPSAPRPSRKGQPLGKVAPKYRDSATGSTWSGRGLKPKWLVAALAAGRSLDEFKL
jgi:DNA-binding protein H-NS